MSLRDALRACANLTRHQETSPTTVREVGERVNAIVEAALAADEAARKPNLEKP